MILSGNIIRRLQILDPCEERTRFDGVSFGLSSAGYDLRIDQDLTMFPGDFKLASTVERFKMPLDVVGIVHDKSTWARRGIALQNTVVEPGWEGWLTLELTNHGINRVFIREGSGIAQILFHVVLEPNDTGYEGKYMNQARGPQPAILEK